MRAQGKAPGRRYCKCKVPEVQMRIMRWRLENNEFPVMRSEKQ